MKVGDYVRTKRGQIHKITDIKPFYENNELIKEKQLISINGGNSGWNYEQFEELIIKCSPNIIDLIEVGDYVNGCKVIDIVKGFKVIIDKLELDTTTGLYHNIGITNIKSIVTKEQFSQMEYKVKE